MDLGHGVTIDDEALGVFCERHGVRRLAVFGSLTSSDFGADSDVDVLVEFQADRIPGLIELSTMEMELEAVVGRRVDLRTLGDLSRYFRAEVAAEAREIYAA